MKRLLAIALLAVACTAVTPAAAPADPTAAPYVAPAEDQTGSEAPPAGEIWFGTGFDPVTYATEGRLRSAPISQEVAIVTHFDRTVEQSMRFQVLHGADDVRYNEVVELDSPIDLYGVLLTFDGILVPGSYTIRFRDAGGHTVATGTLKLTK